MPSSAPRLATDDSALPLLGQRDGDAIAAWRRGEPITAAAFLADIVRVADALPDARHVLNACADRYRFAVLLCAAVLRGQTTLLPPTTTANVIAGLREFAPGAYFASDDAALALDLPRFALPPVDGRAAGGYDVPSVPGERTAACVFTSGSTGEPKPNLKTWASLVNDVGGEARRLGVGPQHTVLGTVPPQHMYGFESTVMLPLASGARLTAERLYYPADIDAAIRRAPAPRLLFTTPFHLRAWIESGDAARIEAIVSATAPLPAALAREAEAATGAALLEIYGCTEAGQVATREPTRSPEWRTLDGVRIWVEDGQAMVAGGHVAQPTPLQDVIEVRDATRFVLHGRSQDLVNIAGKRNSLGYLDHQLNAIPGVKDAAFFLPDEEDGTHGVTRLMAFVVAPGLERAAILAALRERIDAAFMPRPLVLLPRLPREATGKLPRAALQALAREHAARKAD